MNKMTCKSSTVLLALSVLSLSLCLEPASAATPVNCGDNLNAPGQYILTGNLSCSGTAVTITASNVHFDLAGFTIAGDGTGTGIDVGGGLHRDIGRTYQGRHHHGLHGGFPYL